MTIVPISLVPFINDLTMKERPNVANERRRQMFVSNCRLGRQWFTWPVRERAAATESEECSQYANPPQFSPASDS